MGPIMLDIEKTKLEGVVILTPRRFADGRGYFSETWNQSRMAALDLDYNWVQDNQSLSMDIGTIRGLHFQYPPYAQHKLVRCGQGAIFDVAVDIRKASKTYGQWVGVDLTAENGKQLLVPSGFLHGFVTRSARTEVLYKCSDFYAPDCEGSIIFSDASLAIDWGIKNDAAILSDKDKVASSMDDFDSPF